MVMHIMNTEYFGIVMVPLESHNTLEQESQHFDFILLEAIGKTFLSFVSYTCSYFPKCDFDKFKSLLRMFCYS